MSVREVIGALLISVVLGLMITFIGINLVLGCDSWDNPNCLTPKQFLEITL